MRYGYVCGLVLAALTAAIPAYANDWSKVYPLTGRPALRLDANDGSINLVSADLKEIQVRITSEGWQIGKDVQVTENQNGNSVEIQVRVPEFHWQLFNLGRRSLRIELRVPREADLDLHTGDGNVDLQAVSGRIRVDTGDGGITSHDLKGEIWIHSGDGRIEGSGFDGALDADTGDGSILVRGRFDALQLKSGDGTIDATAEVGSRVSNGWSIRTGDGTIRLRLPQDFNADLDAHTGDGRIQLDLPVTVSGSFGKSSIKGRLAAGGGSLLVRTGDGPIYLERL